MKGKKVKCQRCEYIWHTMSKNYYVSCPMCMTKVKVKNLPKKGGDDNGQ